MAEPKPIIMDDDDAHHADIERLHAAARTTRMLLFTALDCLRNDQTRRGRELIEDAINASVVPPLP